jgi:hypothetical protein
MPTTKKTAPPLDAPSPKRRTTSFKKGHKRPPTAGRKKGQRNRVTVELRHAILEAAALVGGDGKGKNGLTGYLQHLASREKKIFGRLLEKVLPMQLSVEDRTIAKYTPAEAVERLRERNLPIPPTLLALAAPSETAATIAGALYAGEDYEAELAGVMYRDGDEDEADRDRADED